MNIAHPENTKVLSYLSPWTHKVLSYLFHRKGVGSAFAPWDSVQGAYYSCGCHPDIVERLWDQIGPNLPADCRCLIHGTPALAHPKTGVILAIGIGTQYGLRLPGFLATEAIKAGAKTHTTWSSGGDMDIRRVLGEDWVFGAWLAEELSWCKRVYEMFDHAA